MNETEALFVKTFIVRDRRERWLSFLASDKNRGKLLHRLAHSFEDDLDSRFVFDKDKPPTEVSTQVQKVLGEWKKANPNQLCHLISNGNKDGQMINISDAETDLDLTFGTIIIIVPDKLAYYHPERSNLSRQPYKVLFHP